MNIDWRAVQTWLTRESNEYQHKMTEGGGNQQTIIAHLAAVLTLSAIARAIDYGLEADKTRRNTQAVTDRYG